MRILSYHLYQYFRKQSLKERSVALPDEVVEVVLGDRDAEDAVLFLQMHAYLPGQLRTQLPDLGRLEPRGIKYGLLHPLATVALQYFCGLCPQAVICDVVANEQIGHGRTTIWRCRQWWRR